MTHAALLPRFAALPLVLALNAAWAQTPPATPPAPAAPAASAPTPQQLDKVEVTGQANDNAVRRNSTASKIVISREDLLRFGDGNLADLMRRLPGVTPTGRPGRGGGIAMRGMGGGFTQLLVNGERMAPGFSIDQIAPDQIERIEIQRAPTAETGARAVAGTINIILREPLAKKLHELRVQVGADHGEPQGNIAWTRNDSLGSDINYSLTVVGNHQRRLDDIDTVSRRVPTNPALAPTSRTQDGQSLEKRSSLNVNGRLLWRLGEGEQLTVMPFAVFARGGTDSEVTLRDTRYASGPAQPYQLASTENDGRFAMLRGGGMYTLRLNDTTRLELRANGGRTELKGDSTRRETGGILPRTQRDQTKNRDDNLNLVGKTTVQTDTEHNWVSGAELEWGQRENTRLTTVVGQNTSSSGDLGDALSARSLRLAAYTQDEWQINPNWGVYGGLRYEQINNRGEAGVGAPAVDNTSRVLSPLVHALWKPDPKGRDQVRMSLTRSYRAANLNDLVARRVINAEAPLGPNTEDTPDRAGNAALKPELATGLELAFEHYLPKGGLLSANVFARKIKGLIRTTQQQELAQDLSGAPVLRFINRPRNLGNATTLGIELEAKAGLGEFWDEAPAALKPLQLRANLSVFDSTVDGIPGPNNRIDAQPRGTANLGADYRVPGTGLSLGASWSFTPEVVIQQTETTRVLTSKRRVWDAYAQWTQSRDLTWRLGLSNLAPLDAFSQTVIANSGATTTSDTFNRTFTTWTLRGEWRF
jgi:iron complex outermembrane receptor protein